MTRLILVPSLLRVLIAMADEASESRGASSGLSGSSGAAALDVEGSIAARGALGALGTLLPKLRYWTTSGEALTFDLMADFFRAYPAAVLLNL